MTSHADQDVVRQDGVGEPDDLERLWTPHRMAYIKGENKPTDATSGECPFCRIPTLEDRKGLVVHRGEALGAQAGPKRTLEVFDDAGFGHVRHLASTAYNIVIEARD